MKDKTIFLPYGKSQIRLRIPDHIKFKVLDIKKTPPVGNFKQTLNKALDKPINALPFNRNFRKGDKVTIAIPDKSRRGYSQLVLEILVQRLKACGIPKSDITIIIARGTHPAHSKEELKALMGEKIYRTFKIVDHDCRDAKQLEYVGRTSRGTEASLNRAITEADKIITCGVIQFHYFAGFSGGRKLITPGCADYNTVLNNHRLALNPEPKTGKHPNATIGRLAGNPMHNDLMEIIELLKAKGKVLFSIDMVLNSEREVSHFSCGDIRKAHEKGCALVKKTYTRKLDKPADFIIASAGGFPSDITFIQTHKTIEHASKGLKSGGNMLVLGECAQGIGSETFLPWLKYKNLDKLEKNLRRNFAINGHTALCTLIKARDFNIYMKTALNDKLVQDMEINLVKDVQETLDKILESLPPRASVVIIPQGFNLVPAL
ncbi:MAG: nickel-dependent lactate racemase [Planctomycetes bacterium]|nr:nickel-dependent lactate racemase [Planctomycetota bacterium]